MPKYDFECGRCGKKTERITNKKKSKIKCSCGGRMNKVVGVPSIQFKGKGFYSTSQKKDE